MAMPAKKRSARRSAGKSRPKAPSAQAAAPSASRPQMPAVYKIPHSMEGSVPWEWAEKRLTESHNYMITTVRPDGRPHSMLVWGIWLENAHYFSTGETTRKAKNLVTNSHCVLTNDNLEEAVIVEGEARPLRLEEIPAPAYSIYQKKYSWKLDPEMGPVFKLTPRVVFALPEKLFPAGATRWHFD